MRILHAIHDFLPRHQAGSEIYAYELCRAQQSQGHQTHVVCAEYDPSRPHGSLDWRWHNDVPVTEVINNWAFTGFGESYRSPALNTALEHALRALQPDILHIHNLLNLSFDLPVLAAARGVPSVATLHDFTLVCPSGGQRVHRSERHVCFDIDWDRCARCFRETHFQQQMTFAQLSRSTQGLRLAGYLARAVRRFAPRLFARLGQTAAHRAPQPATKVEDIEERWRQLQNVFAAVALFVAPSKALAEDFRRFGLPADKIRVSDYGFVPLTPSARTAATGNRLRIGFVGTLTWHKGVHILIDAVRQLPAGSFELRVYGDVETFPDYVAELKGQARGLPVSFEGGFDREQVAEVYASIDVLVVASLWPENSPLVIHEAYMAGVPIVGSRVGGVADLVDNGRGGLLYEAFSAESLATCLKALIDEPQRLERLRQGLPPVKTMEEDCQEWERIYDDLLARRARSVLEHRQ